MTELNKLKELAEKATPGPWSSVEFARAPATDKLPELHTRKLRPIQHTALGSFSPEDADFIAAANPQAILDLIRRVEILTAGVSQIAAQKIGDELGDEEARSNTDYELGYEECVKAARGVSPGKTGDAT